MNPFFILFRQGPHPLTPDDLARRQQEVSVWARAQNAAGHALEPRLLAPERLRPGADAGDADPGWGAWPVTALLFLQAADLAQAARVAASHPACRFGAHVEVRPWAPPAPVPAAR